MMQANLLKPPLFVAALALASSQAMAQQWPQAERAYNASNQSPQWLENKPAHSNQAMPPRHLAPPTYSNFQQYQGFGQPQQPYFGPGYRPNYTPSFAPNGMGYTPPNYGYAPPPMQQPMHPYGGYRPFYPPVTPYQGPSNWGPMPNMGNWSTPDMDMGNMNMPNMNNFNGMPGMPNMDNFSMPSPSFEMPSPSFTTPSMPFN